MTMEISIRITLKYLEYDKHYLKNKNVAISLSFLSKIIQYTCALQ